MRLTVKVVEETPDGGGICQVEYDSEALELLLQYGFTAIMKAAINDAQDTRPLKHNSRGTV